MINYLYGIKEGTELTKRVGDEAPLVVDQLDPLVAKRREELESEYKIFQKAMINNRYTYLTGFFAFLMLISIVSFAITVNFSGPVMDFINENYIPWIISGLSFVMTVVGFMLMRAHIKKIGTSDEYVKLAEEIGALMTEAFKKFEFNDNCLSLDILTFLYKMDGDKKVKVKKQGFTFRNGSYFAYVKDGYIFISEHERLVSFPITAIVETRVINEKVKLYTWHKHEPAKSKRFKSLGVKINSHQETFIKYYYEITLEIAGNRYLWYVPSYEIETLIELFGVDNLKLKTDA